MTSSIGPSDLRVLSRPALLPSSHAELERGLAAAGEDPERICALLADACAAVGDLAVVLVADPVRGGLAPVSARHAEPGRADAFLLALGGPRPVPPDTAGATPDHPDRAGALPSRVRAALAAEGATDVVLVPVTGRVLRHGVAVVARRAGRPAFDDAERALLADAGRRGGAALEIARLVADGRRQSAIIAMLDDAMIATGPNWIVTSWNAAAERIYGIPAADAVGRSVLDLISTTYAEGGLPEALERLRAGGNWRGRVRQITATGRTAEIDSRVSVQRDGSGAVVGMVAVNQDVTEQLAAEASAELQLRFARELMDALDTRGAVLDAQGQVIAANGRWRTALADRELCACGPVAEGENWLEALAGRQVPVALSLAADVGALLHGERDSVQAECRCAAAGPNRATAVEVVRIEARRGGGAIVVLSDVSWRRRMQDEASYRASHDELTTLPNRAALMAELGASLERLVHDGGGRQLAVLFCDLDGFKDINDGLGHAVGDQVLVAVARRLRQRCRSADLVARFGGDEFVVVMTIESVQQAVAMAERIVEVLAEPIVVGDAEVAPGVSVGITVVDTPPEGDDPVGTLLRDADTAMYHAKDRGRGRYELFDARLRENIAHRLELAAALHHAVAAEELEIRYQARRTCGDRQVAGVEALLSWRHPEHGRVAPETFIPIAERTGRIVELGAWVLRRALAEFAAVADAKQTLAVNVSPRQLTGAGLVHTVASALAESGVEPWRLVLEITESAIVEDPASARAVLTDLRALGVTIALDDFGTGWSSLSYLRTLPVDVLVDRSFVRDLPTDPDACAVVAAVLGLGHGMGLVVVAEGVEREEQLDVLRDMGCDEYQGFIDGQPASLAEVLDPAGT